MASDYQIDVNGTLMGDGTVWDVVSWGGLEEWTTRNTDVALPSGWGNIGGSSFVNSRVAVVTIESVDPTNVTALEVALVPTAMSTPSTLYPIRWKFPNREELVAYGRVSRRMRTRDISSALGLTQLTFELEIPDPRAYAYVSSTATAPVYVGGTAGIDYATGAGVDLGTDYTVDATTNLGIDYVGVTGTGLTNCVNNGDVETYPVFTISAAAGISSFSITNWATAVTATFAVALGAGQVMIVDMRAVATNSPTATPVSIGGVSYYGAWVAPRNVLALPPGTSTLIFTVISGDANATCGITWQSAYL